MNNPSTESFQKPSERILDTSGHSHIRNYARTFNFGEDRETIHRFGVFSQPLLGRFVAVSDRVVRVAFQAISNSHITERTVCLRKLKIVAVQDDCPGAAAPQEITHCYRVGADHIRVNEYKVHGSPPSDTGSLLSMRDSNENYRKWQMKIWRALLFPPAYRRHE